MAITLRAARVNKGLTQAKAAELIGIKELTLRNYEKGVSYPTAKTIIKMLEVYGVSFDDLCFGAGENS